MTQIITREAAMKNILVYLRNTQVALRATAKPGTKNIKRDLHTPDGEIRLRQTDLTSFKMEYETNNEKFVSWVLDGVVETVAYRSSNRQPTYYVTGHDAVLTCKNICAMVIKELHKLTPRGKVESDMREVRDWVQLNSKGKSGRCQYTIKDKYDGEYRIWTTPGGNFLLVSYGHSKCDLTLSLEKGESGITYSERRKGCPWYTEFDDKTSCLKASKWLRKHYPAAFQEKGIRVD